MSVAVLSEHRASNGRFAPGRSGNPAGRPKGARNRMTLLAEAVLEENSETLLRNAVAGALGGDAGTLRFLLGRLIPPASIDQPVALDLAPGEERDPEAILTKTVRAMADGEVTPKQALQIARVVAIIARLKKAVRASSPPRLRGRVRVGDDSAVAEGAPGSNPPPQPSPARGEGEAVAPSLAPVSDQYFFPHDGGIAASGAWPPVSDLYFPVQNAFRAPRSDLFSTTAIGLAPGMAALRGVESPRAALPI